MKYLIYLLMMTSVCQADPIFIEHKALQQTQPFLGVVLSDIESHMIAGHEYRHSDMSIWGHETTHGINSLITNNAQVNSKEKVNAFYVLNGRAAIIKEPSVTISQIAKNVPLSLRNAKIFTSTSEVYQLYLIDSTISKPHFGNWNEQPLYIFDEWVAYCNGNKISIELKSDNIQSDTLNMFQFNVFALCVAYTCKTEDVQFKEFLKWNLKRSFEIAREAESVAEINFAIEYWKIFQHSEDAEQLREFVRVYLGKEWTKTNLGI